MFYEITLSLPVFLAPFASLLHSLKPGTQLNIQIY